MLTDLFSRSLEKCNLGVRLVNFFPALIDFTFVCQSGGQGVTAHATIAHAIASEGLSENLKFKIFQHFEDRIDFLD